MEKSGAMIIKDYLVKYVHINQVKTKKNHYEDHLLARKMLGFAYDIIHRMEYLIFSNNANDVPEIKKCIRENVALMRKELKRRQGLIEGLFINHPLPADIDRCIQEAWKNLLSFENKHKEEIYPSRFKRG